MFIPPEGAMQFEWVRRSDGKLLAKPMPLWVKPADSVHWIKPKCSCKSGFHLVMESLTDEQRQMASDKIRREGPRRYTVCACMGRIIE